MFTIVELSAYKLLYKLEVFKRKKKNKKKQEETKTKRTKKN